MKKKRGTNNFTAGTNKKKKYTKPLIDSSFLSEPDLEAFKKFILESIESGEFDSQTDSRLSENTQPTTDDKTPRVIGIGAEAVSSQLGVQESLEQQPKPFGSGLGDANKQQTNQQQSNQQQPQQCPCPLDNIYANKPKVTYRYCNFTNSELFYFISTLSPLELVIFYTIFAIALTMNLNLRERTILGALFVDVGFTINTMVQQEAFQANFTKDAQANKDRVAYLARQNNMSADIELLKEKLEALTGTKITLPTEAATTTTTQNQTSASQIESEAIANEDISAASAEEASTTDLASATSSLF